MLPSMLELRPSCEHCDRSLPPSALDARICSFECTFCARCVDELFDDVCPNCGGGFSARPVRPAHNHHDDNWLGKYPASSERRHRPKDLRAHALLAAKLRGVAIERR
jgi:hypothetical protein